MTANGEGCRKAHHDFRDMSNQNYAESTAVLIASKLKDSAHFAPLLSSTAGLAQDFSIFTAINCFLRLTAVCTSHSIHLLLPHFSPTIQPLEDRKSMYLSERLMEQKLWYGNKAKSNATAAKKWFWAM